MHSSQLALSAMAASLTIAAARGEYPPPAKLTSQTDLPNPLIAFNGKPITTKEQWFRERRPELKALFQHYMYGEIPKVPITLTSTMLHEDPKAYGGKATLREFALRVDPSAPPIHVLLVVPNQREAPAPVFVGINFCGNHALVDDPKIHIPECWMYPNQPGVTNNRAAEAGRGKQKDVWALDQAIDRGYAVATFYNGDVDPDQKDVREGLQPFFRQHGAKPATIAAWAWGVQRVVDFVLTRKELDSQRVAAVGHSRLGKTALLAAAFDERISLAIPHQAGCGGTAPSRGKVGESVQRINTSFPHWFNHNFKLFNGSPERLPFDQNCLVALVAPRPVLFSNATEDTWANPAGQFEVLQAADPVYRFLGAGGLDAKQMPENGKLVDSTLGYYIRPGKHSMTREDWKIFLDFADKNLKKGVSP